MLANCTMLDSLQTSRVQASVCNLPRESRRTQMFLATSIIYAVAFVSVALRLAGKIAAKRLGWDDAFVVASVLITAIPMGSVLAGTARGFGEHAYGLEDRNLKFVMRTCKSSQLHHEIPPDASSRWVLLLHTDTVLMMTGQFSPRAPRTF